MPAARWSFFWWGLLRAAALFISLRRCWRVVLRPLVGGALLRLVLLLGRSSLPLAIARGACAARCPCRAPANALRRCAKRGGAHAPLATLATAVAGSARPLFSAGARCCAPPLRGFPVRPLGLAFAALRGLSMARPIPTLSHAAIAAMAFGQWLIRGLRPRQPLPAERARGRGVFHSIEKATSGHFFAKCPPSTLKKI